MKISLINIPKIESYKGGIFKILKSSDQEFTGFGEVYISNIKKGEIKAWKKHLKMTCILIPIHGQTKVVIYNNFDFHVFNLNSEKKKKLIIPPHTIFGFTAIKDDSSIMNIANIEHDPKESIKYDLQEFKYDW